MHSRQSKTDSIRNFRDFGGYASHHGGRVRLGKLYRSGHVSDLGADARAFLLSMDFATIADLRYQEERDRNPSPWPAHFEERLIYHDHVRDGVAPHLAMLSAPQVSSADVSAYFGRYYAALPFDPVYRPLFASFLTRIADRGPALVHCTAGKDRTGVLVALTQAMLGVAQEDILEEFLLSKDVPDLLERAATIGDQLRATTGRVPPDSVIRTMLSVEADYIRSTFRSVVDQAGSIDRYLDDLGISSQLRRHAQEQLLA